MSSELYASYQRFKSAWEKQKRNLESVTTPEQREQMMRKLERIKISPILVKSVTKCN